MFCLLHYSNHSYFWVFSRANRRSCYQVVSDQCSVIARPPVSVSSYHYHPSDLLQPSFLARPINRARWNDQLHDAAYVGQARSGNLWRRVIPVDSLHEFPSIDAYTIIHVCNFYSRNTLLAVVLILHSRFYSATNVSDFNIPFVYIHSFVFCFTCNLWRYVNMH